MGLSASTSKGDLAYNLDDVLNAKPGSLVRYNGKADAANLQQIYALQAQNDANFAYAQLLSGLNSLNAYGSLQTNSYVPPPESIERWCERLQKRVEEVEEQGMDYSEYSRWCDELEAWRAKTASEAQPVQPDNQCP